MNARNALLKKTALWIGVGYAAILLLTFAAVLLTGGTYTAYVDNYFDSNRIEVVCSPEGIVENTAIRTENGVTAFTFRSLAPGDAQVHATIRAEENDTDYTMIMLECHVLPTGVVYLAGYDFGGHAFVVAGLALLTLYSFVIFLLRFRSRRKTQFFSYKTVLDLGLAFFTGLQGAMYAVLTAGAFFLPARFEGWVVYNLAGFIMSAIFLLSIPLIVLFSGFLTVSNISLIRHEGFRRNNLFGLLISAMLYAGAAVCIYLTATQPNVTGVTLTEIRDAVMRSIVSSAFVYFECILFSTLFCTQYAARHQPGYGYDFVIVLGCKIRDDGTPKPLLRGRIDRALSFYHEQLDKTGKPICFIPSGGQGSDEVMSEAQSMKNYLLLQGIDERLIFPEDASTNTLENMRNAKAIAESQTENAKMLFSTTNYHVFRSGILAEKAGMHADGIGAKTKWYFWPNAQMREFIGLMASEWKINAFFIALIVALSTLLANISTIISWIV